jgi:hypothetical protein
MRVLFMIVLLIVAIYYLFRNHSIQIGGASAPPSEGALEEVNTVAVISSFTSDVMVKGWRMDIRSPGIVALCTLRKTDNGIYTIIGETLYQATQPGAQSIDIIAAKQLPVKKGDYYGIRAVGKNIIKSALEQNAVITVSNSSKILGVGSTLENTTVKSGTTYIVSPITTTIFMASSNVGSQKNPAKSAQHILQFYKANSLGQPTDGIYWIRPTGSPAVPMEIYCNFSLRQGHAYMLIGAADIGTSWPSFNSGKYPFSPDFSYGQYDKYGRIGTYYLKWSPFDIGAISNNNPDKCKRGGHVYNTEGKYCGLIDGKRLKVNGSITEILLATGNNKYWVVLDRDTLVSVTNKTLVPIASSENYEDQPNVECSPNKNVYMSPSPKNGDPWINMGTGHACGKNYMFWGDGQSNEQFKNENGGIKVYVGGEYVHNKKSVYKYHPTSHLAPGRKSGQSSYKEAMSMCRSLGKKICTKKQLEQAHADGFGGASCGWTSTGPDPNSVYTMQPLSIDLWASDEIKDCKILSKDTGTADIYCCDMFEFMEFQYLDSDYANADIWVTTAEQNFKNQYNTDIPVNTKLIVYGESKKGVSVMKVDESSYELTEHISKSESTAPLKWPTAQPAPKCQITGNVPSGTTIKFLTDLPDYEIKVGDTWPKSDMGSVLKFGSTVRFMSNSTYLTALDKPYKHISLPQVILGDDVASSLWKVEPVDTTKYGTSVENNDLVYLYNTKVQGRLVANSAQPAVPGSPPGDVLLSIYKQNNNITDCQWKIQPTNSKFWTSQSKVRIQHVNTGKIIEATGMGSVVSGSIHYDQKSEWTTVSVVEPAARVDQCAAYLNKITQARLMMNKPNIDRRLAAQTTQNIIEQYDKECYDVPQSAYNRTVQKLYKQINKQLKLLTKETGLYEEYHAQDVALKDKLKTHTEQIKTKSEELQKLRTRCIPVKKCVEAGESTQVNAVCKELSSFNGTINDELINKIRKLKAGKTSINDYDIRTHSNADKYIKNTDVKPC